MPEPSPSSPSTTAATEPAYSKFRADGWPLCPGCGEDELWSNAAPATIDTIVSCLRCNWRPGYWSITAAGKVPHV